MDVDFAELEGYRGIYAQALIQLRKDLASPVQQFFISEYGTKSPKPFDWHLVVGSHLAALDRDRDGIDESLFVPTLASAISLWMRGGLLGYGLLGDERRDALQRSVNLAIQVRLDTIYGQGDPLLAAVCIVKYPEILQLLTRNIGLKPSMADHLHELLWEMAIPLDKKAWKLFRLDREAAKISMFRPSRELNPEGDRQFFR